MSITKRKSKLTAVITSYKTRHSPYTERPDYKHYLTGLMSELYELTNKPMTLECDDNYFGYYCYVYLNPLKPGKFRYVCPSGKVVCFKHEPFYVGKGKKERNKSHIEQANYGVTKNHKLNTIRSILNMGSNPIILTTNAKASEWLALAFEVDLIAGIGRKDKKLGPLANLTDGGDGPSGYTHSTETRRKMSKDRKGRKLSKESITKREQTRKSRIYVKHPRKHSEEHKANISKGMIGHKVAYSTGRKISEAKMGHSVSKETREKIRKANLGKSPSEATRRKLSDATKAVWARRRLENLP